VTGARKSQRSAGIRSGLAVFLFGFLLMLALSATWAQYPSGPQVKKDGTAILIRDYASLPLPDPGAPAIPKPALIDGQLARVNFMRPEPAGAPGSSSRFFVNNMDGTLYILEKKTKKFVPYLDFAKIFPKLTYDPAYEGGFAFLTFDPDYAKNGKFYTSHTEDPGRPGSASPTNAGTPGLNLDGYTTTPAVNPPGGDSAWESVVVEWTDTNISNETFEGTAREILRIGFYTPIHQVEDMIFDPLAKPGTPDYGNLYVSVGDGGAGQRGAPANYALAQRLDALNGKILRITPDIHLRPMDQLGSNDRYRIPSTGPDPNPFLSVPIARPEVFVYGVRNPQRLFWDKTTNNLIEDEISQDAWEEVNIIHKGANYGYPMRESDEQLFVENGISKTGSQKNPPVPFPEKDRLTVAGLDEPVTPLYPAITYSHMDGNSTGSGYVYRGKRLPQLRGKFIFGDVVTGRIFYANLPDMLATNGIRNQHAPIHEIQIYYKSPYEHLTNGAPQGSRNGPENSEKRRMYDIVVDAFQQRGGKAKEGSAMPGSSTTTGGWRAGTLISKVDPYGQPYGGGRADVRLAMGADGELYLLSKTDGMIREIVSVVTSPPPSK